MILGIFLALGAAGLQAGEVAVRVDPFVELAGAAQLSCPKASDPADFRRPEGEQLKLLRARFPKAGCVSVSKRFGFSARAAALLVLASRPDMEAAAEANQEAVDAAGGKAAFEAWLEGLRSLAKTEVKVEAQGVPETASALEAAERSVSAWAPLARSQEFAGYALEGRQALVISQFLKRDAVYSVVDRNDSGFDIFTLVSSEAGIGGEKDHWGEGLGHMLLHESAHGLLDDLADLFAEEIAARRPEDFKSADCNGSWHQCVKEHAASAAAGRMAGVLFPDDDSDEDGEPPPGASLKEKLPYMSAVEDSFMKFQADRKRWPSMAHFYPVLLDAFGKSAGAAVSRRDEPAPERIAAWMQFLDARLKQGPSEALSAKRASLEKGKRD